MHFNSLTASSDKGSSHDHGSGKDWIEIILKYPAFVSYLWLATGIVMKLVW